LEKDIKSGVSINDLCGLNQQAYGE